MADKKKTLKEKYKDILQRPKSQITADELVRVREEAESAKRLLESEEFAFFRQYLRSIQDSIVQLFVNNRIKAVTDSVTDEAGVTKTFETTKEEQLLELSGQYKLIETMMQDLRNFVDLPKEFDQAQKKGSVEVIDESEG